MWVWLIAWAYRHTIPHRCAGRFYGHRFPRPDSGSILIHGECCLKCRRDLLTGKVVPSSMVIQDSL